MVTRRQWEGILPSSKTELEFASGELRMDVTAGSALDLWKSRQAGPEAESCREALERGRRTLRKLQSTAPEAW
jgi:hypothetical protein